MKRATTSAAIEKFIEDYKPLPGFQKRVEDYSWGFGGAKARKMILENPAEKIRFELVFTAHSRHSDTYSREEYGAFSYAGHTYFDIEGRGEVTFDRTGVEDSFTGGPKLSLTVILALQIEKIVASRKRAQSTKRLPWPLVNFYRTADEVEELKKQLQMKGTIHFYPSGFGTGYTVTVGRKSNWAKPAGALTQFFGVGSLYYTEMDCD